jgi:hypothetical protein
VPRHRGGDLGDYGGGGGVAGVLDWVDLVEQAIEDFLSERAVENKGYTSRELAEHIHEVLSGAPLGKTN